MDRQTAREHRNVLNKADMVDTWNVYLEEDWSYGNEIFSFFSPFIYLVGAIFNSHAYQLTPSAMESTFWASSRLWTQDNRAWHFTVNTLATGLAASSRSIPRYGALTEQTTKPAKDKLSASHKPSIYNEEQEEGHECIASGTSGLI